MDVLSLFDRPIGFHRCLAEIASDVKGGLFISQAIYWTRRTSDKDGWFWKTYEQWHDEIMLSRKEIDRIREDLTRLKILQEKLIGFPPTLHYRIDQKVLSQFVQKVQPNLSKRDITDCPKGTKHARAQVEEETETTTETTTAAPKNGAAPVSSKKLKLSVDLVLGSILPDLTLQSLAFKSAWKSWVENRLQLPKATLGSFEEHMKICKRLGESRAIPAIRHSIASSYLTIWEPKQNQKLDNRDRVGASL